MADLNASLPFVRSSSDAEEIKESIVVCLCIFLEVESFFFFPLESSELFFVFGMPLSSASWDFKVFLTLLSSSSESVKQISKLDWHFRVDYIVFTFKRYFIKSRIVHDTFFWIVRHAIFFCPFFANII